jgi:pimeloyl-ACP methyl ester carboxylesterase
MAVAMPPARWLELGGPVHHVAWDGPPTRTFVLVHGLGGSVLSWLSVGARLAERGRVLALDLPGFGRTPRAGRRSRLSDNRALLSRFLEATVGPGRVVLCGNSMGGAIAMLEAGLEPGRVEGVVLSDSVFPWVWGAYPSPLVMAAFGVYQLPRVGEWLSRRRLGALEAERAVRLGLRIIAADASRIDPEVVAAHVRQLVELEATQDAPVAFLEAARSLMGLGRRPAVARRILDGVRCPVLVIHGREDRLVPHRFAEIAVRGRRTWDLVTLEGVGHVPQMESADRWLAAVERWLAERLGDRTERGAGP